MADDKEKSDLAVEFLRETGMAAAVEHQIMEKVTGRLMQIRTMDKYQDLPETFFADVEAAVSQTVRSTMTDPAVVSSHLSPIYLKRFDAEELRTLVAFYKTDLGKKVLSMQPQMQAEFEQASASIETSLIVPEVTDKVQALLEKHTTH